MSDERVGPCGEHCAVVGECDARGREITRLRAENEKLRAAYGKYVEAADRMNGTPCEQIRHQYEVDELREQIEKLRAAMHDIYEVYAGSEGFIPQTCPEAYLQERVKEMADIAAMHKRAAAAALKETGDE